MAKWAIVALRASKDRLNDEQLGRMGASPLDWAELSDIFLVWAPMDFLKGAQVGPMGPSWAHGDGIVWGQLGLINYGPFVVCPFGDLPSPLLPHNGALALLWAPLM